MADQIVDKRVEEAGVEPMSPMIREKLR